MSLQHAIINNGALEHLLLEPEVLHVLSPPFVSRPQETEAVRPKGRKTRSFLRKKRKKPSTVAAPIQGLVLTSAGQLARSHLLDVLD